MNPGEEMLFQIDIGGAPAESQQTARLPSAGHSSRTESLNSSDPGHAKLRASASIKKPKEIVLNKLGPADFEILSQVGKGTFGSVYQVKEKKSGQILAMKAFKKDYLIKTDSVTSTIVERDILKKARHPFVVGLHSAFQDADRLYLIMEYVNGGELFTHLRKEAMFSEKWAKLYMAELILALEYLHSNNIVHRDLKPENILIDQDGHVKLTDFGLAKENVSNDAMTSSFCGTVEYMSPEMIKGQPYSFSTDLWSLGIILYDMLAGHPPFQGKNKAQLQKKILNDKVKLESYWDYQTHQLLKGLIERDVNKRLTIAKLKTHKFFDGINWVKLADKEIDPPFRPPITKGMLDTGNFDAEFTALPAQLSPHLSRVAKEHEKLFENFSYSRPMSPPVTSGSAVDGPLPLNGSSGEVHDSAASPAGQ